ncbi:MAG: Holliday junction branch migration protein RuvA [Christensenellaceae bacterium]
MLAYVEGKLLHSGENAVILENRGIGYEILCSATAYSRLVNNSGGSVYTYLAVRDDGLSLYGFEDLNEKAMFLKLITVSGVGPKMAMSILSSMSLNDLAFAIASSDVKSLSSIKGLGKKTAERIVLELREKISLEDVPAGKKSEKKTADEDSDNAVLALMSLGYNRQRSQQAVDSAIESGAKGLENIISEALKSTLR